ncbi:unnamed protein product [Strongylus vulgaris]|uniref:Rapsyn myristoylation/linker region N-terminal domain-containing protein n=1 Tax=Strongylus vulgaris TaxID=40348 RepID=A0A3P7IG00_STRVU|nr:unnamed protein product [Strongylus vulgaris]
MFRRILSRAVAVSAGVQLCAAATALSDKELAKKPECHLVVEEAERLEENLEKINQTTEFNYHAMMYRKDVIALEHSLESLGRHGFNTSQSTVEQAYETLKKYEDLKNAEVQWRLARALVEKAFWSRDLNEKMRLLHEAHDMAKQAITLAGDSNCAGAHKWYAIVLHRLEDLDKKADHYTEMVKHLEMAAKFDKEDAYTVHLLGKIVFGLI